MFWDKLEKSNTFLQIMIDMPELKFEDRLFSFLMQGTINDGGYWEWVAGLIKKYGAVPKSIMPETYNSSNTHALNIALNTQLISATKLIRDAVKNGASKDELLSIKHQCLEIIFEICAKTLGLPPQKFSFEYRDKDKKFNRVENISPVEFLQKYVGDDFLNKVNLLDDPRSENPKNRLLVAKYYRSVIEEKGLESLNVTMSVIKKAVIESLKDNEPVWFDCDVDSYSDRKGGIFDLELYKYEDMLNIKNQLSKEDRVNYRLSAPTHAMTIIGVNLDNDGNPINWEIENSWGDEVGKKGYFSMSDKWFEEYVFGVIVDPKYVDKEALKGLNKPAIELEPWDPLS
ncbi:C1 family peptidase [Mycoplasmopsis caviae]|uniref:C1 family peptidase n=1 Tax=Mycoplasmopsis caviae TaxID=55603 RepID=UPI002351E625|nr:C1 family peptidase [Mycoplasmopsis caviae]